MDPVTLADRGRELNGLVAVSAFKRLASALHSHDGEIEVRLRFGVDEKGRRTLTGSLAGTLELVCQRCLAPYELPIDVALSLVLVESESEAATLPEEVEALVVGDRRSMYTVDMIEDDLILALPVVPRHGPESHCEPAFELLDSEAIEAGEQEAPRQNPFAVLANERH